jgi:hypothetical protein
MISRGEFLRDICYASEHRVGYAAGKIGLAQQYWMYYPILLRQSPDSLKVKRFHEALRFNGLNQNGIFPADPNFYLEFNRFYVDSVRQLDCLGLCLSPGEPELLKHYRLTNKLIPYGCQEPDRSGPSDEANCYLPFFRNKRLLLVCPFASLLKERATKDTFEGVWANTGKKWFYPAGIQAVEFPYGFSPSTHARFVNAIELYEWIGARMDEHEYDVALIAAAGLGVSLAARAKRNGKIAVDLGGHLQVLFGVLGKRWKEMTWWHDRYVNGSWIDMPEQYRPKETGVCDNGAYW